MLLEKGPSASATPLAVAACLFDSKNKIKSNRLDKIVKLNHN